MSVNAYRMNRNQGKAEYSTFDLWHDEKLMELLNHEMQFYMSLNSYGTGIVDVSVELLEKAVGIASELTLDEDTIEWIRRDIEYAKSNKDESVTYNCW
ncbi:MAG: hypothetical protein PHY28_01415 [Dehalococcoidales bacterium]|nr:hypothetical protein [Dehalococcoidales bacterium]